MSHLRLIAKQINKNFEIYFLNLNDCKLKKKIKTFHYLCSENKIEWSVFITGTYSWDKKTSWCHYLHYIHIFIIFFSNQTKSNLHFSTAMEGEGFAIFWIIVAIDKTLFLERIDWWINRLIARLFSRHALIISNSKSNRFGLGVGRKDLTSSRLGKEHVMLMDETGQEFLSDDGGTGFEAQPAPVVRFINT